MPQSGDGAFLALKERMDRVRDLSGVLMRNDRQLYRM